MCYIYIKCCSLEDLSNQAFQIIHGSSSGSIKHSFAVRAYLSFCSNYSLDPFQHNPAQLQTQLYRYVIYRLKFLNGTHGTARSDITTIENYLAQFNIHSDVKLWKPMAQLLKAAKQDFPVQTNKKRPFRESELTLAFIKLVPNSWDILVIRCLLAFGLGGALRASEYTSPNKKPSNLEAVNIVKLGRIFKFFDDNGHPSMLYCFFRSKTNQTWKR